MPPDRAGLTAPYLTRCPAPVSAAPGHCRTSGSQTCQIGLWRARKRCRARNSGEMSAPSPPNAIPIPRNSNLPPFTPESESNKAVVLDTGQRQDCIRPRLAGLGHATSGTCRRGSAMRALRDSASDALNGRIGNPEPGAHGAANALRGPRSGGWSIDVHKSTFPFRSAGTLSSVETLPKINCPAMTRPYGHRSKQLLQRSPRPSVVYQIELM